MSLKKEKTIKGDKPLHPIQVQKRPFLMPLANSYTLEASQIKFSILKSCTLTFLTERENVFHIKNQTFLWEFKNLSKIGQFYFTYLTVS